MPRFVILRHETPEGYERPLHWDFMLEWDGVLQTWALESEPRPGAEINAERLADHRVFYLDHEGPVSNDRGAVTRFDQGSYELISEEGDALIAQLAGDQLQCRVMINDTLVVFRH